MFRDFEELKSSFPSDECKTIVVAAAHDKHTLEAVYEACGAFPMKYILVGEKAKIIEISDELGEKPLPDAIVDVADSAEIAGKSVDLIRNGLGNVLMKGLIETGTLLKAVLHKENGIRGTGTMSHLAMLQVPKYQKLIAITDGGMIPHPTLEQKADILKNAVGFLQKLGINEPKAAALAAIESVSEKMPETLDAAELQVRSLRGEFGKCIVEGPLSFDIAASRESANIKRHPSKISGDADIFLTPTMAAGNILSKGLLYWGGAKMAGCVLGAKVPIVLVSRGATSEEKLLSIMLCIKAG